MSHQRGSSHGRGGKPTRDAFDYDFFDGPRGDSTSKKNSKADDVSSRNRRQTRHDSASESDSGSETYSSSESSESESEVNERARDRVKIHANVPTASVNDSSDEDTKSGLSPKLKKQLDSEYKKNNWEGDAGIEDGRRSRRRTAAENGRRRRSDSDSRSRSRSRERNDGRSTDDSVSDTETDSTSGSDITDVSPLTSPRNKKSGRKIEFGETITHPYGPTKPPISPMQRDRPKSGRPGSGRSDQSAANYEKLLDGDKDTMNLKLLMRAIMEMENETGSASRRSGGSSSSSRSKMLTSSDGRTGTRTLTPTSRERKNLSFRNSQVREIDMENQRLMEEILKYATAVKKQKKQLQKPKTQTASAQESRPTTSAINRMREQRRIEEENRAMLRRLEGTKATSTVKREDLLRDFNNSTLYGMPLGAVHPNKRPSKKSPYDFPVTGQDGMRSASMSSVRSDGSMSRPMSGKSRPSSAKSQPGTSKSRPTSAKSSMSNIGGVRPPSAKLREPQYPSRPQSGKRQPVRPAWVE